MSKAAEANLDEGAPEAHLTSVAPNAVRPFWVTSNDAFRSSAVVHSGIVCFVSLPAILPVQSMTMHDVPAVQVGCQEPDPSLAALQAASSFGWTGTVPSDVVKVPWQHCA